jgi:hypothetical protein
MGKFFHPLFLASLIAPLFLNADVSVSAPSSGSESTSSGTVDASGTWSTSGGFKITWNVTRVSGGFDYIYSISNASGGTLSTQGNNFILQMATNITTANYTSVITSSNSTILNGGPQTYTGNSETIYGIDFSISGTNPTISFFSDRAPIYGNFGASTSSGTPYAYNSGINTTPLSSSTNYAIWVPIPGSVVIPEPSALLLLSSSIVFVIFFRNRRSEKFQKNTGV